MTRCFAFLIAITTLGFASASGATEPATPNFIQAVERAIAGDRLIQAETMIARSGSMLETWERGRLEAKLMLALRHDAEAFRRFERLLVEDASDCELLAGKGIAALRLARPNDAEPALLAATAACPGLASAWSALAVVYDQQAQRDAANAAYSRALAIDANNPALLNNAGVSLLAQRRYADAIGMFKRAISLDPANQRAKNNLDIARVASGERPSFDAEDDSRRRAERLNNAGYMALLAGDEIDAARYFSEAIKINPFEFMTAEANLRRAPETAVEDAP